MSKADEPKKKYNKSIRGVTTFVVTAAQNATGLNVPFMRSLGNLCNHRSAAGLYVIPYRYKNPTSLWTEDQDGDEWWSDAVEPNLCNQRKRLNKNLVLMGDVPIQATSSNPLSGMEGMTHGESGIFGHPRVQLRSVPTLGEYPRVITSTGSCTLRNYTDTRLGKLGEFHHTTGAVIVEVRGKIFHLRQINATQDGSFVDKDYLYTPNGVRRAPRPLSLNCGDVHVGETDPRVEEMIFGSDGMVARFRPQYMFFHDVFNGTSCNPHTDKNYLAIMERIMRGSGDVRAEVLRCAEWIDRRTPKGTTAVIVPSNHNDWLTRWMQSTDPRFSGVNRSFWRDTDAMLEAKQRDGVDAERLEAFAYWLDELLPDDGRFKVLKRDDSFVLEGVENGLHGDAGINGGKGTLKSFSRLDLKVTFGHTHVEGIEGGAFNNGTLTRIRGVSYAKGPSSWTNASTLQYFNGKRTLIRSINGEYEL